MVRSPLGRVRHLPLVHSPDEKIAAYAERQAINSPIQATLSDMCIWAIAILNERHPDLWVAGMTHDNLLAYVPENEVEYWASEIKEVMENLPLKEKFGWETPIPFPADAEAGISLASLEDVKM